MKWVWALFGILVFAVLTDWLQEDWARVALRGAACLMCAGWLGCWIFDGREFRVHPVLAPVIGAAAWGALQALSGATVSTYLSWNAALAWTAIASLMFVSLQLRPLRSCFSGIALFAGLYSLYAMLQFLSSEGKVFWVFSALGQERVLGTFLNQNHYSALMELLFPIVLWRLFRDRQAAIFAVCALLVLASVVVGSSRMGIALLLLELLFVGIRRVRRPTILVGGVLALGLLIGAAVWPKFEQLRGDTPYLSRNDTARASLAMFRDRPLMGFGLGSWAQVFPAYAVQDTGFRLIHADDDWLEWAAEGGAPLFALMLVLAYFAIRAAYREPWSVGCVAVLLHSAVEFPLHKQSIWVCYAVILAMAYLKDATALRKHSS